MAAAEFSLSLPHGDASISYLGMPFGCIISVKWQAAARALPVVMASHDSRARTIGMMPFSVLRIWGTGLLSWAIIALAAYCLWEAAHTPQPRPYPPQPITERSVNRDTNDP